MHPIPQGQVSDAVSIAADQGDMPLSIKPLEQPPVVFVCEDRDDPGRREVLVLTGVGNSVLEDVPALETWSRGSVVIAGDAAHGMLPFAGQGAAQAIEDALVLVYALDIHDDPATAFKTFETERKPRADRIRSESHWLGTLGTMRSRIGTRARNLAVKLLPGAIG